MYNSNIRVVYATPDPADVVCRIAKLTQMNPYRDEPEIKNKARLIEYLYKAEHRSVFQHVVISVYVTDISRALADQIRTAHHLSVTTTSQHYTDHSEFPVICASPKVSKVAKAAQKRYAQLIEQGESKEEARQALPMAMGAAMYITANAQAWASFLHQRLCERNVPEMVYFARRLDVLLCTWFPELFIHVGQQCFEGICKQGPMACKTCPRPMTYKM